MTCSPATVLLPTSLEHDDFEDTARIRELTWDALLAGDMSAVRSLMVARFAPLPLDPPTGLTN